MSEPHLEKLWAEYSLPFSKMDDMSLARWLAQTLGQFQGGIWRMSHPLLNAYRLAARQAHQRQIWLKRLANPPASYALAECCRAPLFPVFTREIASSGLFCQDCESAAVPFEELPEPLKASVSQWAKEYEGVHAVAHWDEAEQGSASNYNAAMDAAAQKAEALLKRLPLEILPPFLDFFPALVWEDQDECLDVTAEQTVD